MGEQRCPSCHSWSFRFFIIGSILIGIGSLLNFLVIEANKGMPVAATRADILFIIGDSASAPSDPFFSFTETNSQKVPLTSHTKFAILSDRIFIGQSPATLFMHSQCTAIGLATSPQWEALCPFAAYRMASIGDMFLWLGVVAFIFSPIYIMARNISLLSTFLFRKTTRT